jgi:hypothetical protein
VLLFHSLNESSVQEVHLALTGLQGHAEDLRGRPVRVGLFIAQTFDVIGGEPGFVSFVSVDMLKKSSATQFYKIFVKKHILFVQNISIGVTRIS